MLIILVTCQNKKIGKETHSITSQKVQESIELTEYHSEKRKQTKTSLFTIL